MGQAWVVDSNCFIHLGQKAKDKVVEDLKIALNQSKDLGVKMPSTKSVLQSYKKLSILGDGQLDTSSLIKLLEN